MSERANRLTKPEREILEVIQKVAPRWIVFFDPSKRRSAALDRLTHRGVIVRDSMGFVRLKEPKDAQRPREEAQP